MHRFPSHALRYLGETPWPLFDGDDAAQQRTTMHLHRAADEADEYFKSFFPELVRGGLKLSTRILLLFHPPVWKYRSDRDIHLFLLIHSFARLIELLSMFRPSGSPRSEEHTSELQSLMRTSY